MHMSAKDGWLEQAYSGTHNLPFFIPGSSARRVIITTSDRNAIVHQQYEFNFLLIANMQQHDSAWQTGCKPGVAKRYGLGPEVTLQPGHCLTIDKHHPACHEVLTRFGDKKIWRKVQKLKL